jgi:hypothetical protein
MEPVTFMAILALAGKGVVAALSVVGVTSGMNWMSEKTFKGSKKKGGESIESELNTEKFHRHDS